MRVIMFAGKQGAGKTTLVNYLFDKLPGRVSKVKFAQPLYDCQDLIHNLLRSKYYIDNLTSKDRRLLQLLGTDWGRSELGEDVWVRCLINHIKSIEHLTDFILIDDCRYPNELYGMVDAFTDTLTVYLKADESVRMQRAAAWGGSDHKSETSLDACIDRFHIKADTTKVGVEELGDIIISRLI